MKITVYALASDTRHGGSGCQVFGSESEFHDALRDIMSGDLDAGCADSAKLGCLLDEGKVMEAWEHWLDTLRDSSTDSFVAGEREIEIELPQVDALIGAATYVECRLADACDYGVQDKSPFYPSWRKITEALKRFSPAPTVSA